jgi:hypothetical protein
MSQEAYNYQSFGRRHWTVRTSRLLILHFFSAADLTVAVLAFQEVQQVGINSI